MKNITLKHSLCLAVFSGILIGLSFPARFGTLALPNLGFLAWISLVPLFVAIDSAGVRKTFLAGFLTGFTAYSISLYWLYNAMTRFGGLTAPTAIVVLFLLMVLLGSYFAAAPTWVKWFISSSLTRVHRGGGFSPPPRWTRVLLPMAWVAVELARNYFPCGGFPWNNIAYSQSAYPLLIQTGDLFGIYGVLFLIILVNQLLAKVIIQFSPSPPPSPLEGEGARRAGEGGKFFLRNVVPVATLLILTLSYGFYKLHTFPSRSPARASIKVALLQGNIPQGEKWEASELDKNLGIYRDLTRRVLHGGVDLILWPESSYPYTVPLGSPSLDSKKLGLEGSSSLLLGALSVDEESSVFYNSALLVDSTGRIVDRYHKVRLVPFGEYVPLKKFLFFAGKMVAAVGDFHPGAEIHPLRVKEGLTVGSLICYEDVFPEIAREMVVKGANLLANMTNDAWYGWTGAAEQHLFKSIWRAVENRRYVVRTTNTGATAVIDPKGLIELRAGLFEKGLMISNIPLFSELTVYDKIGDLFAYLCSILVLLLTAVVAVRSLIKRR